MPISIPRIGVVLGAILMAAVTGALAQSMSHTAEMEVVRGRPYVMVKVNGQGPFRFVVDTGTGAEVLVTPDLVKRLKIQELGEEKLTDPTRLGGRKEPVALLDSIEVAGEQFEWIEAIEHKLPDIGGVCDGMLGFPIFRDYLLTLDYPNHRLTLADGALEPDGENSVVPFHMPDKVPVVALGIGGETVEAEIDSGGSGLSVPEELVSRLSLISQPEVFGTAESLFSRFQLKSARLASDVRLGRYTFEQPYVEIISAFPQAYLGASVLENFVVTFDQKDLLVRIESSKEILHLNTLPIEQHLRVVPVQDPSKPPLVPVG